MSNTENVQTGFAKVNGTTLYYEIAGAGHPFVLEHGHLLDRRSWDAHHSGRVRCAKSTGATGGRDPWREKGGHGRDSASSVYGEADRVQPDRAGFSGVAIALGLYAHRLLAPVHCAILSLERFSLYPQLVWRATYGCRCSHERRRWYMRSTGRAKEVRVMDAGPSHSRCVFFAYLLVGSFFFSSSSVINGNG